MLETPLFTSVHVFVTSGSTLDHAVTSGLLIEAVICIPVTPTTVLRSIVTEVIEPVNCDPVTSTGVLISIVSSPRLLELLHLQNLLLQLQVHRAQLLQSQV